MSGKRKKLDAEIRAAFDALVRTVPSGHLDAFESRVQARLEDDAMTENNHDTLASGADGAPGHGDPAARGLKDAAQLQDIRVLAESTKKRISRRMEAQRDPDEEDDVLLSASSPALRMISLPDPDRLKLRFASDDREGAAAEEPDSRLPAWVYAVISAAAAAAIVFFIVRGTNERSTQVAMNEPPSAMGSVPETGDMAGLPAIAPPVAPAVESGRVVGNILAGDDTQGPGMAPGGVTGDEATPPPPAQAKEVSPKESASPTKKTEAGGSVGAAASRPARGASGGSDEKTAPDSEGAGAAGTATTKPKKQDALDDLLAEASGGAATAGDGDAPAVEKKTIRTRLESSDIQKAMEPIRGKAQACFTKFQVPGTVMIRFGVTPEGHISSAAATGTFKDTDTGNCVADAVKTAELPSYSGAPMTFTYPFLLTQ